MSTIRIAVASTPLTATLEEAVPAAIVAVEEAGRLGGRIVCLPDTGVPRPALGTGTEPADVAPGSGSWAGGRARSRRPRAAGQREDTWPG